MCRARASYCHRASCVGPCTDPLSPCAAVCARAGTTVASVHALLDVPVALAVFYSDNTSPRIASVAVASGPFIYVYRNLRPYMKFTLPQVAIASEETAAWSAFNAGASDLVSLLGRLSELRKEGVHLSSRAQDILALSADKVRPQPCGPRV